MLINVSNHPSARWGEAQRQCAADEYGQVCDLPFPHIDPHWGLDEIEQQAEQYLGEILRAEPFAGAVHLMGEMVFCYVLARKLEEAGIPCVASTTVREVIDYGDGRKEAQFRFVRFRPYF